MNNLFVYLELKEENRVAEVSLELLTKGRSLADELGCRLEAVAIGTGLDGVAPQVMPYGVDVLHLFDGEGLFPYTTLPHAAALTRLFEEEKPQIALLGATAVGRDLGPRVSSALRGGLTADCTALAIGDYTDEKTGKHYTNILLQMLPSFGGNVVATIVNPEHRPQMATVREGVMRKEIRDAHYQGEVIGHEVGDYVANTDFVVKVIERHIERAKHNLKGAAVVVAGGYGVGSRENFDHERMIGQTGLTVRPKLYIACGISGQIQHTIGMQESGIIVSINTDPEAPINAIADYVIIGRVEEVLPKMMKGKRSLP